MAASDGIPVTRFRVDLFASMSIGRLVSDHANEIAGGESVKHEVGKQFGESIGRPTTMRKQAVTSGGVQWSDQMEQTQHRRDGTIAGDRASRGEKEDQPSSGIVMRGC